MEERVGLLSVRLFCLKTDEKKFTLLFFLSLISFSLGTTQISKVKNKKVKLQLNNKVFELYVPKGYILSINTTIENVEYLFR